MIAALRFKPLFIIIGYYLLWLTPRIYPIHRNVLCADDFVHLPEGHLGSYRPLLYLDLSLWNTIFGSEYLRSPLPKYLGGLYIALLCFVIYRLLGRWGVPSLTALIIPVFYVTHPIINELTLYNVACPYGLSVLLIVWGYYLLDEYRIAAIPLIALGISGYQIHVGLIPVLLLAEFSIRTVTDTSVSLSALLKKASLLAIAACIYALYIPFSKMFGVYSWGGRGLISESTTGLLQEKWHGVTNMYANLFQPFLSYFFGINAAQSKWKYVTPIIGILAFTLARVNCLSYRKQAINLLLPIILPVFTTIILLGLNTTPMGWRVCAPVLFAFTISTVPLLTQVRRSALIPVFAIYLIFSLPPTVLNAKQWVEAMNIQEKALNEVRTFWSERTITNYKIAIDAVTGFTEKPPLERPIVMNFNRITPGHYMSLSNQFAEAFLRYKGFSYLNSSIDQISDVVVISVTHDEGSQVSTLHLIP